MAEQSPWWHVDSKGRRIGYMWPEDLRVILDSLFGHRKGINGFAAYAGVSRVTIDRYCSGIVPIPRYIALLVTFMQREAMQVEKSQRQFSPEKHMTQVEAPWLPGEPDKEYIVDRSPFP